MLRYLLVRLASRLLYNSVRVVYFGLLFFSEYLVYFGLLFFSEYFNSCLQYFKETSVRSELSSNQGGKTLKNVSCLDRFSSQNKEGLTESEKV